MMPAAAGMSFMGMREGMLLARNQIFRQRADRIEAGLIRRRQEILQGRQNIL